MKKVSKNKTLTHNEAILVRMEWHLLSLCLGQDLRKIASAPLSTMELKVPLLLILATGVSLGAGFCSDRWQTASQTLENTVRDSVIGCAENLLLGSLRTYQSSLTYVFQSNPLSSLQQLPWKPQCHFPHCLDRSISWKLFQSSALLKVERLAVRACFCCSISVSVYTLCMFSTFEFRILYLCLYSSEETPKSVYPVAQIHVEVARVDVLHLTFTLDRLDCSGACKA